MSSSRSSWAPLRASKPRCWRRRWRTRYGPFQAQLKAAAEVAAPPVMVPSEFVGTTLGPGLTEALAAPALPAAPLTMPSQADIDAIEAIRKASPHKLLIEALQQQIDTIKAGMATS